MSIKAALGVMLIGLASQQIVACSSGGSDSSPDVPIVDPNDNIPPPTTDDIATTLLMRSDYSTLLFVVERAGLTEVLQTDNSGEGWTLFAPSDIAFGAGDDVSQLTTEESAELVQLHLFPGTVASTDLREGLLSMSLGSVEVQFTDTGIKVGEATIVGRDRVVGNGIIHFVDSVLVEAVN